VTGVFDKIVHHIRMVGKNKMTPERLIAIGRTSIKQCLIGQEGTDIAAIKVIHAHSQAANQVTKWKQKYAKTAEVKFADSNGAAINLAIEAKDPTVVAIGPAFGIREGVRVLLPGIDNHQGSVTNFALVQNRNREPLQFQNTAQKH
jgi:prephenate dehydratase